MVYLIRKKHNKEKKSKSKESDTNMDRPQI